MMYMSNTWFKVDGSDYVEINIDGNKPCNCTSCVGYLCKSPFGHIWENAACVFCGVSQEATERRRSIK